MDDEGTTPVDPTPDRAPAEHLATISYEGRFWEVYMEFQDRPEELDSCRARLRFDPADGNDGEEPVRTATIIIERTFEDAMRKGRSFADHQLSALLRSALPDPT
jgi:hypothetical protein